MAEQQNKVWGVFVGERGYELETFNSQRGQFPPEPSTEGYIAIGWPAIGDMNLYEGDYRDYVSKFRKVYKYDSENAQTMQANIPWNFAFVMKENDWVICPSSATNYLLVGKIISNYIPHFHNELGFYKYMREIYLHLRKVQWLYVIPSNDPRYSKLNKIGNLAVTQPNISIAQVKAILDTNMSNTWSDRLIEETRNALNECFFAPDGFLHMKNINGSYGRIHRDNLIIKKWLIQDKKTDGEYFYDTIDELIAADWAID